MADQRGLAPVIIKRKKIVASDGHHGGAWKVAIVILLDDWRLCRRFRCSPILVKNSSF